MSKFLAKERVNDFLYVTSSLSTPQRLQCLSKCRLKGIPPHLPPWSYKRDTATHIEFVEIKYLNGRKTISKSKMCFYLYV